MPRTKRLDIPGVAQHLIQRGNDRQACFFREQDYMRYLQDLREAALRFKCRIHAYVLMTNHVHLLVTPEQPGALARMMQAVGRRYVRYVNDSLVRTGTLWEGRYKANMVDSERYVLACYRYIELNPVRAGMQEEPSAYRWSSFRANAYGVPDCLVTPHEVYRRLAADERERQAVYRDLVSQAIPQDELTAIRLYAQRQRALGTTKFQAQIEKQLGRRAGLGSPGRPRISSSDNKKVL